MEFVTIKESHTESDLLVLKSRLESELQVSINDLERAQEILHEPTE